MNARGAFSDQILELPPRSVTPPPNGLRYIIASSARTGSTLLADALAGTGLAGTPDEFFVTGSQADRALRADFGAHGEADYIDRVIRATATPNGVFGTKLFWPQWDVLIPRLLAKTGMSTDKHIREILPDLLTAGLGSPIKYIWLRRRNKVAQAISLYRASQSGVWRSVAGRQDGDSVADREVEFDFSKIDAIRQELEGEELKWGRYFQTYRLTALMLVYEDFIENYARTLQGVLKFFDLPYEDILISLPKLEQQADERSQAWETRYQEIKATQKEQINTPHI